MGTLKAMWEAPGRRPGVSRPQSVTARLTPARWPGVQKLPRLPHWQGVLARDRPPTRPREGERIRRPKPAALRLAPGNRDLDGRRIAGAGGGARRAPAPGAAGQWAGL